jgi:hypothetical protein
MRSFCPKPVFESNEMNLDDWKKNFVKNWKQIKSSENLCIPIGVITSSNQGYWDGQKWFFR